jgi:hypothetical protein
MVVEVFQREGFFVQQNISIEYVGMVVGVILSLTSLACVGWCMYLLREYLRCRREGAEEAPVLLLGAFVPLPLAFFIGWWSPPEAWIFSVVVTLAVMGVFGMKRICRCR